MSLPDVVLYEPEIPPNTGNIIRLCAVTGAALHLLEPLGFELDDKQLRRAGLDYHEYAAVTVHKSLDAYLTAARPSRLLPVSTRGQSRYTDIAFSPGDALLFGPETRGLPQALLDAQPGEHVLRIPMLDNRRSLNLSSAVGIVIYEAWRQAGFRGAK